MRFCYEIEGEPATPIVSSPLNNSNDISVNGIDLTWLVATNATSYDVYFTQDYNEILNMSEEALVIDGENVNSYSTGELTGFSQYYWRVVANNDSINEHAIGSINVFWTELTDNIDVVHVGESGGYTSHAPINPGYSISLSECLYYAEDIQGVGEFSAMSYSNHYEDDVPATEMTIWIGETDQTELTESINSTELTQVFHGMVAFPVGDNNIIIDFDTNYTYTSGNLVVLTYVPACSGIFNRINGFLATQIQMSSNRSKIWHSESYPFDPANL